jgi:predicted MFS family arabinose efflux permease
MVVFALLPHGASPAAILGCALVCGAAVPPLGSCWRALMPDVLTGPEQRHAAFSLQSALLELTYVAGPALIAGLLAARSTGAAVLACALLMAGGVAAFASHPASRGARRGGSVVGMGALRSNGVRALVGIFALVGTGFGTIQVGVPAATAAAGVPHAAGLLLAAWGAGSLVAGLVATHRPAPADAVRRSQILLIALTVLELPLAFATGAPVVLAAALFVAGAGIAPTFACLFGLVERLAPEGSVTEAYGWLTTGITAGLAVGAGVAGVLAGAAGVPATLALAAVASAAAAVLARVALASG